MSPKDFFNQQVALIAENNISKDILNEKNTFNDVMDIVSRYKYNYEDFFAVYLDSKEKPKLIIKAEDLAKLVELLERVPAEKFGETVLGSQDIEKLFSLKTEHLLKKTDSVKKALRIFTSKDCQTNVLAVLDEGGFYIGKIRRRALLDTIREMLT